MNFHYFVIISPWQRISYFIWTFLNLLHSRNALCQVWLKLDHQFWRRRFFNGFSIFRNYLPLEKGMVLHLNRLESPPPKDVLCQVWLKLVLWFWRRRWNCGMFTDRRTDGRTDTQQVSGKATWAFSLGELKP